jgi:hypothetical protein
MGSKKISIKSGGTSLDMSDELISMTDELVNKLLPETRRKLDKELSEIEDEARSRWLVREKKSRNSKAKIYSEIAITPNFELVGHTGNKAEYAWAILVGGDTQQTRLQPKQRLAHWLMWKPVKDKSNEFAEILADEISKQIAK